MNRTLFYPLLAFCLLVLAILACGESEEAAKVGEVTSPSETEATAPPPTAPPFFKVGDVVEKGDYRVTLNSAKIEAGILVANLTIENIGTTAFTVATIDFSGRAGDGTRLHYWYDCEQVISGEVAPGDKLRGNICFEDATYPAKLYVETELFSDDIVFEITE